MKVYELNADAVGRMIRVDLATVDREPDSPIGHFDFHGCTCGVASFIGQPPWEFHGDGEELLHVLAGEAELTLRRICDVDPEDPASPKTATVCQRIA